MRSAAHNVGMFFKDSRAPRSDITDLGESASHAQYLRIARAVSCPGPLFSIQVPARRKKNREKQMINASQCLVANLRHRVEK